MSDTKWSKTDAENLVVALRRVPPMSPNDIGLISTISGVSAKKVRIIVDLAEQRLRDRFKQRADLG